MTIAGTTNNPEKFFKAIKPLTARMRRRGLSIEKNKQFVLKCFNKHQVDFNNVSQSKQELVNLVFYIIIEYFSIDSGQAISSAAIAMLIRP